MPTFRIVPFAVAFAVASWSAFAQQGSVLAVENPFARPSAGASGAGAAYMTIRNPGPADRLIAAASPVARTVELHTHIREGDVMRMRKIEAIEIPGSGAATLAPGGLHVMLMGLHKPLKTGDSFALTLTFEKAGAVTIQVPVREMGAGAPMGGGHPPAAPHGSRKH
jgi:hypothetical protein